MIRLRAKKRWNSFLKGYVLQSAWVCSMLMAVLQQKRDQRKSAFEMTVENYRKICRGAAQGLMVTTENNMGAGGYAFAGQAGERGQFRSISTRRTIT